MDPTRHSAVPGDDTTSHIDTAVNFSRRLWQLAFLTDEAVLSQPGRPSQHIVLRAETVQPLLDRFGSTLQDVLATRQLSGRYGYDRVWFRVDVFQPVALARTLFAGMYPEHLVRYYVMRNIRIAYGRTLSYGLAQDFRKLARAATALRSSTDLGDASSRRYWHYAREVRPALEAALENRSPDTIDLFVEVCRAVGYIRASFQRDQIDFRANVDPEFLISYLFGMPTEIRGFDDLFGGGGLILTEDVARPAADSRRAAGLGGRAILIKGRYGTGKTLLALKLAAEVARRGGVAWIMPLEQSTEECLYALESIGALPDEREAVIVTDVFSLDRLRREQPAERGALIILRTIKHSYEQFLAAFVENATLLEEQAYPLRLIIADPINSVSRKVADNDLRAETLEAIDQITRGDTNVLLVREESQADDSLFEQNIADTVIRLSVDKRFGYSQRNFEILKSRFQREQRGEHPFSIKPSAGITIFPSSAAVLSRIRSRQRTRVDRPIRFGFADLDAILGGPGDALMHGDVIVIQGPEGSYKTKLGLLFLQCANQGGVDGRPERPPARKQVSLIITARDDEETVKQQLKQHDALKPRAEHAAIWICSLPLGFVEPGFIIQLIEDQFREAQLKNKQIARVVVAGLAHWEMSCPLVRADPTFGDTLIELMRRRNVTSVFLCGDIPSERESNVQRPILDSADCSIRLARYMYGGVPRIMLQIHKTRGMRHRGDAFELSLDQQGLQIRPSFALLRIGPGGELRSVPVRLLLHAETDMQERYNGLLRRRIQSSLSRETTLEAEDNVDIANVQVLEAASIVDELQVLQIDEFQLPNVRASHSRASALHVFPSALWSDRAWSGFLSVVKDRVLLPSGDFLAVPFYQNVGLLAYRGDVLDAACVTSWDALAREQAKWNNAHDADELFFDFPGSSDENYNCLFLEILFSLQRPDGSRRYQLRQWLNGESTVRASILLRQLCRPAYLKRRGNDVAFERHNTRIERSALDVRVDLNAIVWRHWYSTANQMMASLDFSTRQHIVVGPLPGGVCIAGEWYLGIPTYSAAPDAGLAVIESLTDRAAEMERLHNGVGLPVRARYYQGERTSAVDSLVSPYFKIDREALRTLVESAVRRSDCAGYAQLSQRLADALRRIIEIGDSEPAPEGKIKAIFQDLEASIAFLDSDMDTQRAAEADGA